MGKKAYYIQYQEVKQLQPRTKAYYLKVSEMFNLRIDRESLNKIRAKRKDGAYKKGKTFSQAVKEYEADIKYENASIQRAYDIWSGAYFEKRMTQYTDNYLKALEKNNIDSDIIDYLRDNPEIIQSGAMPAITDFYIPSRGKGNKYHLNIEASEQFNDTLREFLRDAWGADL